LMAGGGAAGGVVMLLIVPLSIALLLRSSLSELFTGGFLRLVDPATHDTRELDLKRAQRHRDNLSYLIHHGKRDVAIKLCEELKQSGELDDSTLNDTLEFLGVKAAAEKIITPVTQAMRLRTAGNFPEAEQLLKNLLIKNPRNESAALLLLRIYAEDLRQPSKAHECLRAWEKAKAISPAHIEFARRSIDEWSRRKKTALPAVATPKVQSVEELIADKSFGSAIEILERQILKHPKDFGLRLKLAEVHAAHCDNVLRAGKVLQQAAAELSLTEPQAALATVKLKEWRATRSTRK
jgi:tetratricopeptide (TPR) repeat protein